MAEYRFLSTWVFAAPLDKVWAALSTPMDWPLWWDGLSVEELEILPGDVGSRRRFTLKAPFGYSLSFVMQQTLHEPPTRTGGNATGDLAGSGLWELATVEAGTEVRYLWIVQTTKGWMNTLAPLLRPVFVWNHGRAMAKAAEGLARHLGVKLVAIKHEGG